MASKKFTLNLVLVVAILSLLCISGLFASSGGIQNPYDGTPANSPCLACDSVSVPNPEGGGSTFYTMCWDPGSGPRYQECDAGHIPPNSNYCSLQYPCVYN